MPPRRPRPAPPPPGAPAGSTPTPDAPVHPDAPPPTAEPRYQIGDVAARTGVTPRSLRFYEQQGLLRPTARKLTGYRRYSDLDVQRVLLIKQFQQLLGLSLADIRSALAIDPDADPARPATRTSADLDTPAQRDRAAAALDALARDLAAIDHQLARLTQLRADLAARADVTRAQLERLDAAIAERERTITRGRDTADPPRDA